MSFWIERISDIDLNSPEDFYGKVYEVFDVLIVEKLVPLCNLSVLLSQLNNLILFL